MSEQSQLTPMPRQRKINSQEFLDWLRNAGIIPEHTTRVVIDASVNVPVRVYVEQYGTEGLITVEPPPDLRGPQIIVALKREES